MDGYRELLERKRLRAEKHGTEPGPIHPSLYPFQRAIVEWAIRRGRAAIFADCGLGKTRMQIEFMRQADAPGLILAPIAVAQQTIEEAASIGVEIVHARKQSDCGRLSIANYEMLEHFDCSAFGSVCLDESSILKSYMGKTKQRLVSAFAETPWRLCCTATPAPNDYMELGNHSEFLGVMRSNEMLARWFINDSMAMGSYRLKGHAVAEFWVWVHSWAVSLEKPSDVGDFDDSQFALPPLRWHEHVVKIDHSVPTEGALFRMPEVMSATGMHKEMRLTAPDRCRVAADLVNGSPEPWIVWCNTNYEADELRALIPDAVEVRGSDSIAEKERRLGDFAHGRARAILTKPTIAGFGVNWQHCANVVFVGLSYSYEQLYQAIRRSWRFGQERPVNAHVICAESEGAVVNTIRAKERAHEEMKHAMVESMRTYQQGSEDYALTDEAIEQTSGEGWTLYCGDCVQGISRLDAESIGFSVFSPPFANLYIYSDKLEDMGNTKDDAEFFEQFSFLANALHRATITGRLCSIHCKDLPRYAGRDGSAGLKDFPGAIVRTFEAAGWTYHSRVTIWKDPVIEMQRTKNHGLLYKQLRADSSSSRQGMADYVLTFRKWGENQSFEDFVDPVTHTKEEFPLEQWQQWASPVWQDIRQTRVLQFRHARGDKDEKHICPLQLDVIERCIALWSNPGDLVCSPFAGIGSEGYEAVRMRRKFVGFELKPEYYAEACRNLRAAERLATPGIFAEMSESEARDTDG